LVGGGVGLLYHPRVFCVRNGSVTPREEGFAKQTHVMLLGGWYVEDVSQEPGSGRRSQEPWFRRYS
jgi:hypothetical protein